jgi:cytochrome P450
MEALRLHPIAPGITRTAVKDFEFEGFTVQEGSTVLVAMSVPHFMAEIFPAPQRFDLTRFTAPRNEHKAPGAYMPFGLGPHACLGAGAAQVQMVVVVAQLLHQFDLEWVVPAKPLAVRPDPTLTLGNRLKVRLCPR